MNQKQTRPGTLAGADCYAGNQHTLFDGLEYIAFPPSTRARRAGPSTSLEAAESACTPAKLRASHALVLAVLKDAESPLTVDEIEHRVKARGAKHSHSRIATTPSEMHRLGLIERCAQDGLSRAGNRAHRWQLTHRGLVLAGR